MQGGQAQTNDFGAKLDRTKSENLKLEELNGQINAVRSKLLRDAEKVEALRRQIDQRKQAM
jgi:hypothetical protein